jgi:hypothetical protein
MQAASSASSASFLINLGIAHMVTCCDAGGVKRIERLFSYQPGHRAHAPQLMQPRVHVAQ